MATQIFCMFSPMNGKDPIWLAHIFQMGWFNHQLDMFLSEMSLKTLDLFKNPSWFCSSFCAHFAKIWFCCPKKVSSAQWSTIISRDLQTATKWCDKKRAVMTACTTSTIYQSGLDVFSLALGMQYSEPLLFLRSTAKSGNISRARGGREH